ncbi:MAG: hypothetical protein ACJ763_12025 [Bdellovibrionia bacterium]
MKYVNPDSTHTLDIHSPDQSEDQSEDQSLARLAGSSMKRQSFDVKTAALMMLGAGAVAYLASMVVRRQFISSLRVGDLKVGNLEVDHLKIKNRERTNSSMEESGGVLRFELGSSDVFENGLE